MALHQLPFSTRTVPALEGFLRLKSGRQILSCDCPPANDLSRIPQLVINVIDEHDKQFSLCMSPDEFILESVDPLTGRTSCVPSIQRGSTTQPVPLIFGMTCARVKGA